tara:strand:+ start:4552 stop:5217 length:666 start_codon:yes stop_codon:yes gene_type:complete
MPELIHDDMKGTAKILLRSLRYSPREVLNLLTLMSKGSPIMDFPDRESKEPFPDGLKAMSFTENFLWRRRPPSIRSLRRWSSDVASKGDEEAWKITDTKPEYVSVVLDTLANLVERSGGRRKSLTRAEANLFVSIFNAAPELPTPTIWALSQYYLDDDVPNADIDVLLALAPWKDFDHRRLYWGLVEKGVVTVPWYWTSAQRLIDFWGEETPHPDLQARTT